jgi:hypothetical protein
MSKPLQPQIDLEALMQKVDALELSDEQKREVWRMASAWAKNQHTVPNLAGFVSLVRNPDRIKTPVSPAERIGPALKSVRWI